jgi:hypothetical protein
MLQTFMFSLVAFSIVFIDTLWHRIRLGRITAYAEQLKLRLSQ